MAEIDWTTFAQGLGEYFRGVQSDITQRETEERAKKHQLQMAREMQSISLEGLSKQLDIQEPSKIAANNRLLENSRTLAQEADQRQRAFIKWGENRNKKLNIFAGSEGWADAIDRARKGKGLSEVEIMKMEDSILRAKAGEAVDPSAFEALTAFDRLPIMDLLKQNNMRVEEHKIKMGEIQRNITQNQELMDYRRRQEEVRARTEERYVVSAGEISAQRQEAKDIRREATAKKDEKEFSDHFSGLMNELMEEKVLNSKGKFRIDTPGRLKKDVRKPLFDPRTGELDQKVLGKLLERHPTFAIKFQRLFQLQGNVMKSQAMRDGVTPQAPQEPTGEAGIPEGWIERIMKLEGLTKEEAIAAYKRLKRQER